MRAEKRLSRQDSRSDALENLHVSAMHDSPAGELLEDPLINRGYGKEEDDDGDLQPQRPHLLSEMAMEEKRARIAPNAKSS